jgi:hypothetical protein
VSNSPTSAKKEALQVTTRIHAAVANARLDAAYEAAKFESLKGGRRPDTKPKLTSSAQGILGEEHMARVVRCPSCGAGVMAGHKFCTVCGHGLEGQESSLSSRPASTPSRKETPEAPVLSVKCPKCSGLNPLTHEFCSECGTSLQAASVMRGRTDSGETAQRKKSGLRVPLILAGLIAFAVMILFVCVIVAQSTPSYKATSTARTVGEVTESAATATRQAIADATSETEAAANATQAAMAAQTATIVAAPTATAEAEAAGAATATAEAVAAANETATAQAAANATAIVEGYRTKAPKGIWFDSSGRVGVAVADFRYTGQTSLFKAGEGRKFVAFVIGIFNESGTEILVSPYDVTLVDIDGYTYSHDAATYDYWDVPLDMVDVQPGNKAQGGLVFKIRKDSGSAQIIFETGLDSHHQGCG